MTERLTMNQILLKHNPMPKYLGITLDRALTYRRQLKNAAKTRTRVNLIQKLGNSSRSVSAETSTSALVYPTAEYCAPINGGSKLGIVIISTSTTWWKTHLQSFGALTCQGGNGALKTGSARMTADATKANSYGTGQITHTTVGSQINHLVSECPGKMYNGPLDNIIYYHRVYSESIT
nr:unnamed protein product [Callosobruchus analis]